MSKGTVLGIALAMSAVFACCGVARAQDVSYNYDTTINFSKYKTYIWVEFDSASKVDQLTDKNIKQVIDSTLATKGLTKVAADSADVFVGYQTSTDQEKELDAYGGGGLGWGMGGGMATVTTSTINVGTLVIDMYDPVKKQLIWRSSATEALNADSDPTKRMKTLQKAVVKMLKKYPLPDDWIEVYDAGV